MDIIECLQEYEITMTCPCLENRIGFWHDQLISRIKQCENRANK